MSLLSDTVRAAGSATAPGELVQLRHELHADPEVGLHLPRTQRRVLDAIDHLPLEITLGQDLSSVTAVIRGRGEIRSETRDADGHAPAVLLRADMDALPVPEETGLVWASENPGLMHACGHDMHTAILVGVAHDLCARREELAGDVVLMFQPGEEMHDGAALMIREGVLEASGRRVEAAYALHVFAAGFPQGMVVGRRGPMMAAADGLTVVVRGKGGHGSTPQRALDPVPVACEIVTALQVMITRRFDVFDPVVASVGSIHAGEAPNAIPEYATITASVRTWSTSTRDEFRHAAETLANGIAAAHGLTVEITHIDGYPCTHTTPAETDFVADLVADVLGPERFTHLPHPFAGSEDFSRVLATVPGTFIGLGATPTGLDPATAPFNHSSYARYDDAVIPTGVSVLAEIATRRLAASASRDA